MRQRPPTTMLLPHTRRSRWLRALGLLIACAGGFVAYFLMQELTSIVSLTIWFLLTILLSSVIGALLWRGWRAPLVVPAALWLGAVAADMLYRALEHIPIGASAVVMALDLLVVAALPAAAGAAIGVAASMWLERRRRAGGAERSA